MNAVSNINTDELQALKKLGNILMQLTDIQINHAIKTKELYEVKYETK